MADLVQVPGRPGQVYNPATGKVSKINEVFEDDIYDTIETDTGAITAGTEYLFFNSMANKKFQHANTTTAARIPSHHKLKLTRVGAHVRQVNNNADVPYADSARIYEQFALEFKLGQRLVTRRPLVTYQSGYGMSGGGVSLGMPSHAAAPRLAETQDVDDETDLNAKAFYGGTGWTSSTTGPSLSARALITLFLHGMIAKPLGT